MKGATKSSAKSSIKRLLWRSLLFVPADREDLLYKAPSCRPDAIILDLEDGVAAAKKKSALENLAAGLAFLRAQNIPALVRLDMNFAQEDLAKIIALQPAALLIPKIETSSDVAGMISKSEISLIVMIENPRALASLLEIAALPHLIGLALGSEDFCLALGVAPHRLALDLPCKMIALAASAQGFASFALPISVGEFGDLEAYRRAALDARAMGLSGALCVHPAQVEVINEVFRPSAADMDFAHKIIKAWEARSAGVSVIAVDGRMVDSPVAAQARRIIADD